MLDVIFRNRGVEINGLSDRENEIKASRLLRGEGESDRLPEFEHGLDQIVNSLPSHAGRDAWELLNAFVDEVYNGGLLLRRGYRRVGVKEGVVQLVPQQFNFDQTRVAPGRAPGLWDRIMGWGRKTPLIRLGSEETEQQYSNRIEDFERHMRGYIGFIETVNPHLRSLGYELDILWEAAAYEDAFGAEPALRLILRKRGMVDVGEYPPTLTPTLKGDVHLYRTSQGFSSLYAILDQSVGRENPPTIEALFYQIQAGIGAIEEKETEVIDYVRMQRQMRVSLDTLATTVGNILGRMNICEHCREYLMKHPGKYGDNISLPEALLNDACFIGTPIESEQDEQDEQDEPDEQYKLRLGNTIHFGIARGEEEEGHCGSQKLYHHNIVRLRDLFPKAQEQQG